MLSEPYKIKEVKHLPFLEPYQRWNILKHAGFNTFRIPSDHVTFDLVARGMSSWTHFQKAAYMVGDEAYAGSRNYARLEEAAREIFGLQRIVPTHNGIGAEKLVVTTLLNKGQMVLHNRSLIGGLVEGNGGLPVDITCGEAAKHDPPACFGANVDLEKLEHLLKEKGPEVVAYIHVETCPDGWHSQPVSLANLKATAKMARECSVPLLVDISNVMENAFWIRRAELGGQGELIEIARRVVAEADLVMIDASQGCRSDVGGFVTSVEDARFEALRNQVVVYEGLHTYGGMTGRAMEVFAVGLEELRRTEFVEWYQAQIQFVYEELRKKGVPVHWGAKGVALDVEKMLPHLKAEDYPKFVLAAALYILGGIRARIDGTWRHHASVAARILHLEIPRCAYTRDQLEEIIAVVVQLYENRDTVYGLRLLNDPEFVDEARFEPENQRLFVSYLGDQRRTKPVFEPYKIAVIEPIGLREKEQRGAAMQRAGYNTFLLPSEDVYIDLLTDSGTSAMSCFQWEGMTNTNDTPYTSRSYLNFVEEFREILGYEHILPTHQGRAAEHIMSQVMIRPGQLVPGNMYFTTTKLHQEMAGGIFVDVIVDEAHDSQSDFLWKGNIDPEKLRAEIERVGAENVAYVSFEMSVNMAGGQPFSMANVREISRICQKHNIPIMFDATRCVENAYMILRSDPAYAHRSVKEILREMLSYGDGCTISCKKDFLVNMGGVLACNSDELAGQFQRMLRAWEGDVSNGGLDIKDIEALRRGLLDSLDDRYIRMRVEQTQAFGQKLKEVGIPIVQPPGSHAIFIDARRYLPHLDQDEYPAQALAAAIYIETGVRTMERGNVSKGRNPKTGENYRPALELVRCTIPRRVYTNSHMDFVVDGIKRLYEKREMISGLEFEYEPEVLRFFQGRFRPKSPWAF